PMQTRNYQFTEKIDPKLKLKLEETQIGRQMEREMDLIQETENKKDEDKEDDQEVSSPTAGMAFYVVETRDEILHVATHTVFVYALGIDGRLFGWEIVSKGWI
ncbi:MAG: hypothetical protein EZS28_049285, partial [Streblomastix strix]